MHTKGKVGKLKDECIQKEMAAIGKLRCVHYIHDKDLKHTFLRGHLVLKIICNYLINYCPKSFLFAF